MEIEGCFVYEALVCRVTISGPRDRLDSVSSDLRARGFTVLNAVDAGVTFVIVAERYTE